MGVKRKQHSAEFKARVSAQHEDAAEAGLVGHLAGIDLGGMFRRQAQVPAISGVPRGCDAIAERYRFATAGAARLDWAAPETERALTAASLLALRDLPGVEGGLWRVGAGPLAYAFPTYEGAGPKTECRRPSCRASARWPRLPSSARRRGTGADDTPSQALLLHACPLPGPEEPGVAGWTMARVALIGGPAYLGAAAARGALTAVLLGSAAWLGWLLLGWSRRLRRIEAALAGAGTEDLPRLAPTGQRDLGAPSTQPDCGHAPEGRERARRR